MNRFSLSALSASSHKVPRDRGRTPALLALRDRKLLARARAALACPPPTSPLPPQIHDGPTGTRPQCHTMCCLSCCPCFVPPLNTPTRVAGRARVFRTASFWLSMIQIGLVIISLCFRDFAPYEINIGLGPWVDTLDLMGAKNGAKIVRNREVWRLLVAIMLHNGLLHLATNLLMQLRLGVLAEITWGTRRFLPLYVCAGVMGSLFSTVVMPNAIGVGASGALCGVLGAWVTFLALHWGHGTEAMQVRPRVSAKREA